MEEPTVEPPKRLSVRRIATLMLWLTCAAVLALFVARNRAVARVDFLLWTVETPLIWTLLAAAALGFGMGAFRIRLSLRR